MTSIPDREEVWKREAAKHQQGKVYCNLCGNEVLPGDDWDRSHVGVPAAMGGVSIGVGHRDCNRTNNVTFVIPFVAKTKRLFRKHFGIDGPGLSKNAMPAGRRSNETKGLDGKVKPRLPRYGKHARTMAALWPFERPE